MRSITIDRRFRGPPNSGNGGYVCGILARNIAGAAEVTLRAPPPLEVELSVVAVGVELWELRQGTASHHARCEPAGKGDLRRGRRGRKAYEQAARTSPVDVLRMRTRPGAGRRFAHFRGLAAPWTPDPSLVAADGLVAPEFVWSALDCPTGYVSQYDREIGGFNILPILLGRLSARIDGRPRPGERCVVTSWQTGSEGRHLIAESALFGEEENLLAIGRAVWIIVDRQVQLGRK
jgi:hypothetical protein